MTDKQIIIDDADVSQCEYYSIKHNSCNRTISGSCIKENCQTFRLLQIIKRKEQECEELRNNQRCAWKSLEGTLCPEAQEQLDQLRVENKILKMRSQFEFDETLLQYSNLIEELKAERDSYIDKYFLESQKVAKLIKVLKEIKYIAERDKEFCIKCNGDKEIDCIECIEGGRALLAKDVIQKISEVKE